MPAKRLVIDANIVIRAVFGLRVRSLIERHWGTTAFYLAEANFEEAQHYVAELGPKRGFAEADLKHSLETFLTLVQVVPNEELAAVASAARARLPDLDGGCRLLRGRHCHLDYGNSRKLPCRHSLSQRNFQPPVPSFILPGAPEFRRR